MALLLGLDVGTTSLKCVLFDSNLGQIVRAATQPTPVLHFNNGQSEHNPQALWDAASACIREAAGGQQVAALAISSMAETGVLIDANGQPLSPMVAWYDRRSEPQAARVEQLISMSELYRITGQRVSPSFGLTKLLWTLENVPDAAQQASMWLPAPAYLLWRLTGLAAVDYTIAARTLLFDQHTLAWSNELFELFHINRSLLPPVYPAGTLIGPLTSSSASETGLSPHTQCLLGGHDHLCAALAAGAYQPGSLTDSTGSANALLLLLPKFLADPSLAQRGYACYAYLLENLYALKGGLKAAGSAVEWLARQLSPAGETPGFAELETAAAAGVGRRAGPIWLPHLIGSGTPQSDRFSKAALIGVQFEHDRGDLFRGMLESLAFWTRQNVEEMQSITGMPVDAITLIGGATRLRLLSQLKADITHCPAILPGIPEAAAVGAALLAGLGSGVYQNPVEAVASLRYESEIIEPTASRRNWYDAIYEGTYLPLYNALKPIHAALDNAASGGTV